MKKILLLLWLLLPLPMIVLHYGPGRKWLALDKAHTLLRQARSLEEKEDWQSAGLLYEKADALIESDMTKLRHLVSLAQIRSNYRQGKAIDAIDQIEQLISDDGFSDLPAEYRNEARDLAGRIHYYAGWVMRLEGARRDLWMEEAELARQNFRLIAEEHESTASPEEARQQKVNLESAVSLQRMSLFELMGKGLPKEVQSMSGKALGEQMAKRKGSRGEEAKEGEEEGEDSGPGAGTMRYQPGSGS